MKEQAAVPVAGEVFESYVFGSGVEEVSRRMILATEIFERLVGPAAAAAQGSGGAVLPAGCRRATDRRQVGRLPFGRRVRILRASAGRRWETVLMQDISVKGVGFLTNDPLAVGSQFELRLAENLDRPIHLRCTVARCEPGGHGGVAFHHGATFEQVLQDEPVVLNDEDGTARPEPVEPRPARQGLIRAAKRSLVDAFRSRRRRDDYSSN